MDNNTNLFFTFPTEVTNNRYAVVVKYEGDYFAVQNDGSLIPATYDPTANIV